MKAICVALLLAACGGPALWEPWVEPEPGPRVAVVAYKADFMRWGWQAGGWYRVAEDAVLTYPVHTLVTHDGRACLVSGRYIVEVPVRARYRCEGGWRQWRS